MAPSDRGAPQAQSVKRPAQTGPLDGVKVVDLTTVVVGPICTRTLADQGADVVKVEAPGGDILRFLAAGSRTPAMSGKFINFNRNKRSIGLNIKQPEGLAALKALIAEADVFVSNVRPEALLRAGLDHASLSAANPRLIHCSILAFGRGGRYYNRPAYDPIIQSLSGVAGTFHRAIGEPRFVPMVMTDHTTGLIAAQSIGFALYRREKTGVGEAIDVPMFENMASFVTSEHLGAATFDPPEGPTGDARLLSPDDLLEDPHLLDTGFWNFDDHPTEGRIRRTSVANKFSGGMREETIPAPQLGRDTRGVLASLGYPETQIEAMLASGAAFEGL